MKDNELRKVVRALLNHLNLKETHDYVDWRSDSYFGHKGFMVRHYGCDDNCMVARNEQIKDLQNQIDKLKPKPKKRK